MMACRDACGRTSTVLSQLFENVPRNIGTALEGYTHTLKGKRGILQTVGKKRKKDCFTSSCQEDAKDARKHQKTTQNGAKIRH